MAYDAEQQKVINAIIRIGRRRGAPRKHIKAALETGRIESNFRNLKYGDADSQGFRQERASLYKNPTNLRASINRFYDEAAQHDRGQPAGKLAADVQRPAAQYRGRYGQVSDEARALLGGGKLKGPAARGVGGTVKLHLPGTADRTTTDTSGAVVDALLHRNGGSLLKAVTANLDSGRYTKTIPGQPAETITKPVPGAAESVGGQGGDYLSKVKRRAQVINDQQLPYQWGGGHAGKTKLRDAVPLDCSGAVSKVLGINPRVSGEFTKWGKPGRGGRITVYANSKHVLVEIDGRFWGTSQSNPGGGAGWIKRSQLTPAYLSQFTARHM